MPFKALCDGEPVVSLDLSGLAWRDEKRRQRDGLVAYACPHCGEPMALATSPRGTPFFKHYPNSDCPSSMPTSPEHEWLQVAVYLHCRELGWTTDIEARAPDGEWTADVLTTNGLSTHAFEVQLAPISGEALAERSAKYRAAGIAPVWLLRKFPARCPFEVPSRTFTTAWAWRVDACLPDDVRLLSLTDGQVETLLLERKTEHWSVSETIVYWRELGAVLAVFDPDDPDHGRMHLRREPMSLAHLVTRTLDGEIAREFAASIGESYRTYYELIETETAAEVVRERLLKGIRRQLGRLGWERDRESDLGRRDAAG